MPSNVPKSFVPKQPVRSANRPKANQSLNVFSMASLVLLIAAAILAGAVFGYSLLLEREKSQKTEELTQIQQSVDQAAVEDLVRFGHRLTAAQEILNNHLTPSALFAVLERDTVSGVQFSDFQYQIGDEGEIAITLQGLAESFNTLAYQSQVLSQNPFLRNQIFADTSVEGETESVSFSFSATVSDELILAGNSAPATEEASTPESEAGDEAVETSEALESETEAVESDAPDESPAEDPADIEDGASDPLEEQTS